MGTLKKNVILTYQRESVEDIFSDQKSYFQKKSNPPYDDRLSDLVNLRAAILERKEDIVDAISQDFGNRLEDETYLGEIIPLIKKIDYVIKNLKQWMRPEKRSVDWMFKPGKAQIISQPLGVIGIMSPWNYPLFLAMSPLIYAIAAGNCVMVKPSEKTPKTSQLMAVILHELFPKEKVYVCLGGVDEAIAFSQLPFDHLFFTGSTTIGRLVMKEAANNLTPVTLELGGKSPVIIDEDYDMDRIVERVLMGKLFNAGQTCVAPDYLIVPESIIDELVALFVKKAKDFYPDLSQMTSILGKESLERISAYIEDAKSKKANIHYFFDNNYPFALLSNVNEDMNVMKEEIFGPLLPILTYQKQEDIYEIIQKNEKPLALYIFSENPDFLNGLMSNSLSGGVCINDTMIHVAVADIPFGGVGKSGIGSNHGPEGFKTFSHKKSVFMRNRINPAKLFYPPYKNWKKTLYKTLLLR